MGPYFFSCNLIRISNLVPWVHIYILYIYAFRELDLIFLSNCEKNIVLLSFSFWLWIIRNFVLFINKRKLLVRSYSVHFDGTLKCYIYIYIHKIYTNTLTYIAVQFWTAISNCKMMLPQYGNWNPSLQLARVRFINFFSRSVSRAFF